MRHIDIILKGRVQGIGFRYQAQEIADKLTLRGYARNMRNGTVSIEAEGSTLNVNKFLDWLNSNPGLSNIININIKEGKFKGFRDFQIY